MKTNESCTTGADGGSILFVDDEPNVLSSIRRMLIDESYEQFYAGSGEEALALLRKTPVDVIVSDMRMPVMDGVEFLRRSREIVPDSVRIVLSGQADMGDVLEAINTDGIWRFIAKPWNVDDMRVTMNNALGLYRCSEERRQLLVDLKNKNEELRDLNENLEALVKRRTELINAQNSLLEMIAEGRDISIVLDESVNAIKQIGRIDKAAIRNDADQIYGDLGLNSTELFPCVKSGIILGELALGGNSADNHEIARAFVPIISIALFHDRALKDAPGLLSRIDLMIDELL